MLNIYTDDDKLKVICDFVDHPNFPYGTTTLTFDINGLSMDATNELILFNNSIGGFVFASFLNELKFNGVQATKSNVNKLFQDTCFNCCNGGGGSDIHIDTDDIVNTLEKINSTLKGETIEEFISKEDFNKITPINDKKYLIYEEID